MLELTDGRVAMVHAHQRRAPSRGRFAESVGAEHSLASTVVYMSEERYMSEETHTEKLVLLQKAERICQKRYPGGWLFRPVQETCSSLFLLKKVPTKKRRQDADRPRYNKAQNLLCRQLALANKS